MIMRYLTYDYLIGRPTEVQYSCCSDNSRCWRITKSPSFYTLQIEVIYLDREPHPTCMHDYLQIYDESESC